MADISSLFTGALHRLPPQEQELFRGLITPEFTHRLGAVNPALGDSISAFAQGQTPATSQATPPAPQAAAKAPQAALTAPSVPLAVPQVTKAPTVPTALLPAPTVQPKTNFADGGVIERGQAPTDPLAPPGAPGQVDDLQRNVSEGEVVVPADVVKAKGVDFFEKLKTTVREAQAKRTEEEAAVKAAQQGQAQAQPLGVPPAPTSNVQPTTTGPLALPQGTGSARKSLL